MRYWLVSAFSLFFISSTVHASPSAVFKQEGRTTVIRLYDPAWVSKAIKNSDEALSTPSLRDLCSEGESSFLSLEIDVLDHQSGAALESGAYYLGGKVLAELAAVNAEAAGNAGDALPLPEKRAEVWPRIPLMQTFGLAGALVVEEGNAQTLRGTLVAFMPGFEKGRDMSYEGSFTALSCAKIDTAQQ